MGMQCAEKGKEGYESKYVLEASSKGLLDLGIGDSDFIWCCHLKYEAPGETCLSPGRSWLRTKEPTL